MPRRSSGRTGPRKRYTVDAFEGIEGLQDDAPEQPEPRHRNDSDSADDFEATAGAEVEQDDDEDDDDAMSGLDDDGDAEKLSEAASDAGENDLDDGISIAEDQDEAEARGSTHKPRQPMPDPKLPGSMYNRGAFDTIRLRGSKYNKRLFFVGPEDRTWQAMIKARDMWQKEDTLPVTRKIHAVGGTGGFHHSFYVDDATREREIAEAWKWYLVSGGRKSFQQGQELIDVAAEEARGHLPDRPGVRSFLAGPIESPRLSKLEIGRSVSLNDAWQASGPSKSSSTVRSTASTQRNGFVLNIGAKVRCVEWAPNRPRYSEGTTATSQYLATAVMPDRTESSTEIPSAFAPLPSFRSSIQLWRLEATQEKVLDPNHPPVLSMILCTRWGDMRALKWCPALTKSKSMPSRHLGLLAGIWGDGGLRVLDIDQPDSDLSPAYKRVAHAALTAHPPATVFTSLTWLSSTRIAAATANGCVAVFDIAQSLSSDVANASMRPTRYFSVASTYIVSITSAIPSHPYILLTTAADGYNRMTDLRQPNPTSAAATLESSRGRSTHGAIVWHEWSQCAISIDDNFAMKSLPIRRFFQSVAVARAKSACTAITTSPYHPFILTGTADGEVFGTNPMCRLLDTRQQAIIQIWFAHEWRRPTAKELTVEATSTSQADESSGEDDPATRIAARGLSRFVEGFRLEVVSRIYREDNQARKKNDRQNMHFQTIYEEETAVTALAWNPNKDYAGWAAAGMGDGLLRIEDLVPA